MARRRRRYPNYGLRLAWLIVVLLVVLLYAVTHGADALFPNDYSPTTTTTREVSR
jgi:hypothetical protein